MMQHRLAGPADALTGSALLLLYGRCTVCSRRITLLQPRHSHSHSILFSSPPVMLVTAATDTCSCTNIQRPTTR
jgi:hypothetical protein